MEVDAYHFKPSLPAHRQDDAYCVHGTIATDHVPHNKSGQARQLSWHQFGHRRLNGSEAKPKFLVAHLAAKLQDGGVPDDGFALVLGR
jgi:hypothetical protein